MNKDVAVYFANTFNECLSYWNRNVFLAGRVLHTSVHNHVWRAASLVLLPTRRRKKQRQTFNILHLQYLCLLMRLLWRLHSTSSYFLLLPPPQSCHFNVNNYRLCGGLEAVTKQKEREALTQHSPSPPSNRFQTSKKMQLKRSRISVFSVVA